MSYDKIDFAIIGPGHSGSTWLRDNLAKLPGVFIPKELNYLTWSQRQGVKLDDVYASFSSDSMLYGEHANTYFSHPNGAPLMHEVNRRLKLIIMARQPLTIVEKHYRHDVRWGQFPSFWTIEVACEHDAFQERYLGMASYKRNLVRWLEHFEPNQFFIFDADASATRREEIFKDLLKFLGLPSIVPAGFDEHSNVSVFTPFPLVHRYVTFGNNPSIRRLCRAIDPLNRFAGRFMREPKFSDRDRQTVMRALGEEASIEPFLSIARSRAIRGCDWF